MFDFFTPTHPFGGQTLRLVAQAQQGGGDVFDIARTCDRIEPGDKDGWEREWLELAQTDRSQSKRGTSRRAAAYGDSLFFSRQSVLSNVRCVSDICAEDKKAERFRKAQQNLPRRARNCMSRKSK